jgi:acyl-CoA thioesterase FadM
MPARRTRKNPADLVLRARLREVVHFPDLTERLALRLSSTAAYTAQAHFGIWHKKLGSPDFTRPDAVYTPLVHVELEATDVRVDPREPFHVHGETFLAKTVDATGAIRHLVREGRHTVMRPDGTIVARARLMNVFTRYDADPARRRVTELPPEMNIGTAPSRVTTLPDVGTLVPAGRRPDFVEEPARVWHYGQTDANRHVNGMEYLRSMELYVADVLHGAGHDLRRLYFTRARIVYRKPCFRGEGYRRLAWFCGEAPLTIAGAFVKADDGADARPAAVVELTLAQHDGPA